MEHSRKVDCTKTDKHLFLSFSLLLLGPPHMARFDPSRLNQTRNGTSGGPNLLENPRQTITSPLIPKCLTLLRLTTPVATTTTQSCTIMPANLIFNFCDQKSKQCYNGIQTNEINTNSIFILVLCVFGCLFVFLFFVCLFSQIHSPARLVFVLFIFKYPLSLVLLGNISMTTGSVEENHSATTL